MSEILQEMPAVALRGIVILPEMVSHFDVSRKKSIKAVEAAMRMNGRIFLVTQKDMNTEDPLEDDLYRVGVIAEIKQIIKLQNDIVRVIVEGKNRAELAYFIENREHLQAQTVLSQNAEEHLPEDVEEAMLRSLQEALLEYCTVNPKVGKELRKQIEALGGLDSFFEYCKRQSAPFLSAQAETSGGSFIAGSL